VFVSRTEPRFCAIGSRSLSVDTRVRSTTDSGVSGAGVYETRRAVHEYLQFHYASDAELFPYGVGMSPSKALRFKHHCAELALEASGRGRALDVGCSVGGMSFELARHFEAVVGIDYSQSFVDAALQMRDSGAHEYVSKVEGDIEEKRCARVDGTVDRTRCSFEQGDACSLRANLGTFDAVLAANLLCRLPDPSAFLASCKSLLKPGGVLVLVSPFSWLPEYTSKQAWLGGREGVRSTDVVSGALQDQGLELVKRVDLPFLIREHGRKFQLGVSEGTVWCHR